VRTTLIHDTPQEIDLAEMRRRLARPAPSGSLVAGDPGVWPERPGMKAASVLVPIVAHHHEFTVLLTQRTPHLRSHSGQISFPGGRAEPGDDSPQHTALRETEEEIGLGADRIELIGTLPEYRTPTGYRITPVVGLLHPPLELRPDAREVEEVFEVPLAFLLDPRNHQRHSREHEGKTRWVYAIPFGERYIWGATAGMLVSFYRQLAASTEAGG
jgi:8-oxo-dGTP pyrophosphatase MutT (NUDIX family)